MEYGVNHFVMLFYMCKCVWGFSAAKNNNEDLMMIQSVGIHEAISEHHSSRIDAKRYNFIRTSQVESHFN